MLLQKKQLMAPSKLILVIGATGAQGRAVVHALLRTKADGMPSPYTVRALTRDRTSEHAQDLTALGVECVEGVSCQSKFRIHLTFRAAGSFEDFKSVEKALEGVYGVWVNTDGFTVGDMRETVHHSSLQYCVSL